MASLAERIANRVEDEGAPVGIEDEGAPVGIDVKGEVKVL